MRKFLLFPLLVILLAVLVGAAFAYGIHFNGATRDMTVTVDGETLAAPTVAAVFGLSAALGAIVVGVLVIVLLAAVAIFVPLLLALAAIGTVVALVVGLSPILVPVLLLVGGYVLLSRRARRRENTVGALPATPS